MSTRDGLSRTGIGLVVVAVLALLVAVVAVVAPGAVPLPPPVDRLLTALPAAVVLSLLAFVGVVILFVRSRRSRSSALDPLLEPDEQNTRAPALGSAFDDRLAGATDLEATREHRLAERERVEAAVRDAAVDAYAVEAGADRATAREAVETGAWTDDLRASALVGGPDAPSPSWGQWLFDLLRSESAYHRRVRHAVAEVEGLLLHGEGDTTDEAPGSAGNGTDSTPAASERDGGASV